MKKFIYVLFKIMKKVVLLDEIRVLLKHCVRQVYMRPEMQNNKNIKYI
jgi:hypothetical protein